MSKQQSLNPEAHQRGGGNRGDIDFGSAIPALRFALQEAGLSFGVTRCSL